MHNNRPPGGLAKYRGLCGSYSSSFDNNRKLPRIFLCVAHSLAFTPISEHFCNVYDLGSQLDRPPINKSIGRVNNAEMVALTQANTDRCPIIVSRHIQDLGLPGDRAGESPVCMIHLDLPGTDDPRHDSDVPQRRPSIGAKTQDAARLGFEAAVVATSCRRPPVPGISKQ